MRQPKRPAGLADEPDHPRHPLFDYEPPPYLKAIRLGLMSGVIIAVLAVSYTGFWFFGARHLQKTVLEWIDTRREEGVEISYDRLELGGFPGSFRVLLSAPKMRRAAFGGKREANGWRMEASRIRARALPWKFNQFDVDLSGDLTLAFRHEGKLVTYQGVARRLFSQWVIHGDGWPSGAMIEIDGLGLGKKGAGPSITAGSLRLDAKRLFPEEETHRSPTFSLELSGRGLRVPQFVPLPLGQKITELALNGELLGGLPGSRLIEALSAWRDSGGTVEVKQLRIRHGPLGVQANGTLALDKELQPIGALTARIEGFFAAVDRLRQAGMIRSRDAAMAKLVLGAMAKRPAGGGSSSVSLPLTIQNRKLFAGPVTLAELPPIDWRGGREADDKVKILR
jgi:hypothetical protein